MEFNLKLMTLLILTYINFKYLNTLFILIFIKKISSHLRHYNDFSLKCKFEHEYNKRTIYHVLL